MAIILCLETATTNCSVAISKNGEIISLKEENNQKFSHAEKLHLFIDEVLRDANLDKKQLEAVAISKGPGSYTGLRIGVSAAKGLCFALDIPLISTRTLAVLAHQVVAEDSYIIPLLDARRMEVYTAVFNANKAQVQETEAVILDATSFLKYLDAKKTIFIGDGVEKFKAYCTHKNAVFLGGKYPSAKEMAVLAEAKYKISDLENVAYFEPFYLKEFMMG